MSPFTPSPLLPSQEVTPDHRKTSPDQSTDEFTDDSSRRSISVDPDSGGDSGIGSSSIVSNNIAARRTSVSSASNTRSTIPRRPSSASRQPFGSHSPSFGGLADLAGFHIGSNSPRMYGGGVGNVGYSNTPLVNGFNGSPSSHGRSLLSPGYASLNLPQSSLRSGMGMGDPLEEEEEDEDEDQELESYHHTPDDMEVEDSPPSDRMGQDEVAEDFGAEDMDM